MRNVILFLKNTLKIIKRKLDILKFLRETNNKQLFIVLTKWYIYIIFSYLNIYYLLKNSKRSE